MANQYTSAETVNDILAKKGFTPMQPNFTWIDDQGNIVRRNGGIKSRAEFPWTLNSKKIRSLDEIYGGK